jgi:hypothetical protein
VLSVALALIVAAEPAESPSPAVVPIRSTEATGALGLLSSSYAYAAGRTGELFLALDLDGRYTYGLIAVEGTLIGTIPTAANGSLASLALVVRAGVTLPSFSVTVGALANYARTQAPFQILPSLSAAVRLGPTIASLGVFDRFAEVPARLSVEWRDLGIGWIFPIGGEAFGRYRVTSWAQVEARALAFSLFNSLTVMATAGLVWNPEPAR